MEVSQSEAVLAQGLTTINPARYFSAEQAALARQRLAEMLAPESPLHLIPMQSTVTAADLEEKFPQGQIISTDFYIHRIEKEGRFLHVPQNPSPIGFTIGERIINLDHHAPVKEMARMVSSGNLSAEYVKAFGTVTNDQHLVCNHTDCDSIIAVAILTGIIPPDQIFEDAVIAADHTGEPNQIADLLQGMDHYRSLQHSIDDLINLLEGVPLSPQGTAAIEGRQAARELIAQIASDEELFARFPSDRGDVIFLKTDASSGIQSDLTGAFFPDAACIVIEEVGKTKVCSRVRLGKAGLDQQLSIDNFNLAVLNPNYGGRFNAGSDRRGGGLPSGVTGEDMARYICSQLDGAH